MGNARAIIALDEITKHVANCGSLNPEKNVIEWRLLFKFFNRIFP
jgi:hypothetical protein